MVPDTWKVSGEMFELFFILKLREVTQYTHCRFHSVWHVSTEIRATRDWPAPAKVVLWYCV